MGVLSFWSSFRSPSAVKFSSFHKTICMADEVSISKHHTVNHLDIFSVKRFPRRLFAQFIGSYPILLYANPSFGAPMIDVQEPEIVRFQDAKARQWSSDSSTIDQFSGESTPVILPLKQNQIIEGLKEVLVGMRVGGKRRALIPPSVGYINENLNPIPEEFGPRRSLLSHRNEPLIFEVQLLKVQ
ncbi:peptidyl-prolyl cis-trans isomerase FKBP16-1, chloroplastic isoform X4 [Cucurbita pepo subsp. pepo]|uniref:peptidyl-prolyl cis-trans isomerase FKBP16-1, chloroplastic isoform X4 n=1 Tax=Cucurbita pepo subsp. pepo TaxID=3664 RepID=UPI000C9D5B71|nr:peptidyl-prolyl cis-trans isomerase FKBP16-1, chloroplastic isoform X4 [Cucurbita pepo subsp. pepo]